MEALIQNVLRSHHPGLDVGCRISLPPFNPRMNSKAGRGQPHPLLCCQFRTSGCQMGAGDYPALLPIALVDKVYRVSQYRGLSVGNAAGQ